VKKSTQILDHPKREEKKNKLNSEAHTHTHTQTHLSVYCGFENQAFVEFSVFLGRALAVASDPPQITCGVCCWLMFSGSRLISFFSSRPLTLPLSHHHYHPNTNTHTNLLSTFQSLSVRFLFTFHSLSFHFLFTFRSLPFIFHSSAFSFRWHWHFTDF